MNELTITVPEPVYERIWEKARQTERPVDEIVVESLQAMFLPEAVPVPDDVPSTVARIRSWLAQQPSSAIRPPVPLTEKERQALDLEFENLISAIHTRNREIPTEEVTQDVEEARRQVRADR